MVRKPPPADHDPFMPPDWSGDVAPHLDSLRVYAEAKINNELSWYYRKKKNRSSTSQFLRFSAVMLTVLGGLVPLLISIFGSKPQWTWLAGLGDIRFGQLGYFFLAMAGGLVLLDKYFGYSTGWMRYIVAMQAIEKAREAFRLDWTTLSRKLVLVQSGTPEHADATDRMIQRVRSVILEVKDHSEKETQAWILEFQTNLAQFEKDLKSQMEAGRPGGIDVEVTDGNKADTPIEISLDGMIADLFSGTAGSIGYVAPGLHRVTARAQKANRDYSASTLVNVGGRQICQVKIALGLPA
jgi:hypothetical protein